MNILAPLETLSGFVTYQILSIQQGSYVGEAVSFWIADILKISLLLVVINYFMAITRYFFPMERVREILTHKKLFGLQYIFSALLGAVTPFCSCSSIPLFMGFLSAGIPLGVTFTFLIASPLINESSLFLFPSVFGLKTTILYNLIGMAISIVGGMVIQMLHLEKYIQPEIITFVGKKRLQEKYKLEKIPLHELLKLWTDEMLSITKKIYPYMVIGVTLGAIIHGFVPKNLVSTVLSTNSFLSVPLAVLLGVPLYANSVSVIPIVDALIKKGVPMGTALAFMSATVTLSIPEALILKKILKWQLLVLFFSITTIGIILLGYIFNTIL